MNTSERLMVVMAVGFAATVMIGAFSLSYGEEISETTPGDIPGIDDDVSGVFGSIVQLAINIGATFEVMASQVHPFVAGLMFIPVIALVVGIIGLAIEVVPF